MSKVTYEQGQLINGELLDRADTGTITLEYKDATKTAVQDDEEEGWRPALVVTNDVEIKPTIEKYEAMAGSSGVLMDVAQLSKKIEFDITGIAARPVAKALFNGNSSVTYAYPTSAVDTTVDLTTVTAFVPNHKSIRVAAGDASLYAGMEGRYVIMKTGDAAHGLEFEKLEIEQVDETGDILYFKNPYYNKPIHGADIKLIESVEYTNTGTKIPTMAFRLRKYNNGDNSVTLIPFPKVKVTANSMKLGLKAASEVSFKCDVLPTAIITLNSGFSPSVDYTWYKEKTIHK